MEGFKVYYSKMNTASAEMEDCADKIRRYREDVLDVKNRLRGKISSSDQIGSRLKNIASAMENLEHTMGQMSHGAEVICRTYHRAENTITGSEDQVLGALGMSDQVLSALGTLQTGANHLKSTAHILDAFKHGALQVVEKDGYYIIKGVKELRSKDELLKNIKGTRYKIGSDAFNQSGLKWLAPAGSSPKILGAKFLSNIRDKGLWKNSFEDFGGQAYKFKKNDLIGNAGKALAYAGIALNTGTNIYENYKSGASGAKIAADATTDVARGLAGMAVATGCAKIGAAIGTAIPIPVVGTVVGAAAGFVIGWGVTKAAEGIKIGGKSIAGWIDEGCSQVSSGLETVYSEIGKGAKNAVEGTKKAINGFIGSFGKFAFG